MSKEWGSTQPKFSNYKRAVPKDANELLANLQKLGASWDHVTYCGVVSALKGVFVDLDKVANSFVGNTPDFYIPIKASEVAKADTIVKSIVAKVDNKQPIVSTDAAALYPTLETA